MPSAGFDGGANMLTWENAAVVLLVAGAATYLLRRVWQLLSIRGSQSGCGSGCDSCSANTGSVTPRELVALETLASSADKIKPHN